MQEAGGTRGSLFNQFLRYLDHKVWVILNQVSFALRHKTAYELLFGLVTSSILCESEYHHSLEHGTIALEQEDVAMIARQPINSGPFITRKFFYFSGSNYGLCMALSRQNMSRLLLFSRPSGGSDAHSAMLKLVANSMNLFMAKDRHWNAERNDSAETVSYTHLTLPTICSV